MKHKNRDRSPTGAPGKTCQLCAGFVVEEFLEIIGLESDFVGESGGGADGENPGFEGEGEDFDFAN